MSTVLNINGKDVSIAATPDTPLLWVLRDELQLTGSKYGCGIAQCGACTVHLNGLAVSPDQVAAQMEGGTCYGLSAALYGQITLKDGLVQQKNFDAYRVLRMHEAPQVETWILPSTNHPSGVGEPGTPVIAPAVANALLAMNGKATSSLPFVKA